MAKKILILAFFALVSPFILFLSIGLFVFVLTIISKRDLVDPALLMQALPILLIMSSILTIIVPHSRRWVLRMFWRKTKCRNCRSVIPLIGKWKRFPTDEPLRRHVYSPHPEDRSIIREITCPFCQQGMLL